MFTETGKINWEYIRWLIFCVLVIALSLGGLFMVLSSDDDFPKCQITVHREISGRVGLNSTPIVVDLGDAPREARIIWTTNRDGVIYKTRLENDLVLWLRPSEFESLCN